MIGMTQALVVGTVALALAGVGLVAVIALVAVAVIIESFLFYAAGSEDGPR